MKRILAFALAFGISSQVFAAPGKAELDVEGTPFAQQRAKIQAQLVDNKTYSEISVEDRSAVVAALDRIQANLAGVESAKALPPDKQVSVFNDQELVNGLLTRARADSRVICKREKATGSNMYSSNCATVAERRRYQEASRDYLDNQVRGQGKVEVR